MEIVTIFPGNFIKTFMFEFENDINVSFGYLKTRIWLRFRLQGSDLKIIHAKYVSGNFGTLFLVSLIWIREKRGFFVFLFVVICN